MQGRAKNILMYAPIHTNHFGNKRRTDELIRRESSLNITSGEANGKFNSILYHKIGFAVG